MRRTILNELISALLDPRGSGGSTCRHLQADVEPKVSRRSARSVACMEESPEAPEAPEAPSGRCELMRAGTTEEGTAEGEDTLTRKPSDKAWN